MPRGKEAGTTISPFRRRHKFSHRTRRRGGGRANWGKTVAGKRRAFSPLLSFFQLLRQSPPDNHRNKFFFSELDISQLFGGNEREINVFRQYCRFCLLYDAISASYSFMLLLQQQQQQQTTAAKTATSSPPFLHCIKTAILISLIIKTGCVPLPIHFTIVPL